MNIEDMTLRIAKERFIALVKKVFINRRAGVVLVALIAVFSFAIIINSGSARPDEVSSEFVAKVKKVNSSAAYSLFSAEAKANTTADSFDSLIARIGPILTGEAKLVLKVVTEQTGAAATANIVYEISGSDGIKYVVTIDLIKVGNQWKVSNLNSNQK